MVENTVELIVNRVLKKLNRTKVNGYTFYKASTTNTEIERFKYYKNTNRFIIDLYSDDLKFGGIDDDDDNDALMFEELSTYFENYFKEETTDFVVENVDSQYKGTWTVYIEPAVKTVVNTISKDKTAPKISKKEKLVSEIERYKKELADFNEKIKNRIINQKSKKKTCGHCESNVNVKYFKSHKCPVCHTEMYTETDLKRVSNLKKRIRSREKELLKI